MRPHRGFAQPRDVFLTEVPAVGSDWRTVRATVDLPQPLCPPNQGFPGRIKKTPSTA
jgi:hypothetical protein